jgi:hypothetical protein
MAQIQKGDTFTNGQQVDATRLNQLVDSSVLLVGAIVEQPNITPNTLEATDSTLVNDGGVLKEATIGDILNSNLPVRTSSITGGVGTDIVITPNVGNKVDVAGNAEVDDLTVTDDLTVGGDAGVTGNLSVTGTSILNGNVTANGNVSVSGSLSSGGIPVQKQVGLAFLTRELTAGQQYFLTPAGTWNDLPYNTLIQVGSFVVNASAFTNVLSSAGSSVITLPVGTYMLDAELSIQSQGGGAEMTLRIFNQTASTVIKNGRQTTCNSYVNSRSMVSALFTLTVETQIKVQYFCNQVAYTNYPNNQIGAPAPTPSEVVFTAKIMRLV